MAYYISFLKTLSFRLNKHTIHFFYNEHTNDFPLYTEAIKFFNHSESMVRIAVRTLTLNVYKVDEISMRNFVIDKTASPYFSNLVWFIGNHILEVDACIRNDSDHQSLNRLRDLVAEHLDHLHYINDIFCLQIDELNEVLSDHLLNRLLVPLYLYSLVRNTDGIGTGSVEEMRPFVSRVIALFVLGQVFLIMNHVPLVSFLAWVILAGDTEIFTEKGAALITRYTVRQGLPSTKPRFVAPTKTLEKSLKEKINEDSSSLLDSASRLSSPSRLTEEDSSSQMEELWDSHSLPSRGLTDDEKMAAMDTESSKSEEFSTVGRPFLKAIFEALNVRENDYLCLYSLTLLYGIIKNEGMSQSLLLSMGLSVKSEKTKYNEEVIEKILTILRCSCQYGTKIRLVTLELAIELFKELVLKNGRSYLSDSHLAEVEGVREESTLHLRNFYKSEGIFLDMFEDELRQTMKKPSKMENLMSDVSLLLPPTSTPLTGIDFGKRLSCGEVEKTKRSIRTFFYLRKLSMELQGLRETRLPLKGPDTCVQAQDVLNLNYENVDLVAVTVKNKDGSKNRLFLVVVGFQIVLVEPHSSRSGWGVATTVGFLQDLEVITDKDDSRCLHITVHRPSLERGSKHNEPIMSSSFTFEDHIRCMAAKQTLTKGRAEARQKKMQQIVELLELPDSLNPVITPSTVSVNLHSLRVEAAQQRRHRSSPRLGLRGEDSSPSYLFFSSKVPGHLQRQSSSDLNLEESSSTLHKMTLTSDSKPETGISGSIVPGSNDDRETKSEDRKIRVEESETVL
ncbi:protein CLEC16A homolog isoform X2 [Lepeophtheirus salmonis]